MGSTRIRKYRGDRDYDRVRTVFSAGQYSFLSRFVMEYIASSKYGQVAAGVLIATAATWGQVMGAGPGLLMAIMACSGVMSLAVTSLYVYYSLTQYMNGQLKTTMANIEQNFSAGFWVAEMDDELVGTVGLTKVDDSTAELSKLSVLEKARGLGLAIKLVQELERCAQASHFKTIVLHTCSAQQPAIALYQKMGWQITNTFQHGPFKIIRMIKNIGVQ